MPRKAKTSSARKKAKKAGNRPRSLSSQPIDADVELGALLELFDFKSPNRQYRSQLKDPIVRASKLELMLRGSPEDQDRIGREEDSRIVEEQFGKLFRLLDHFGIPQTSRLRWFHLALQLARQHVPGMRVITGPKPRRGPKPKWKGTMQDLDLIIAVAILAHQRGRGVSDAIFNLEKRDPKRWGRLKGKKGSLRARYYEALKRTKPSGKGNLLESLTALLSPAEPDQ